METAKPTAPVRALVRCPFCDALNRVDLTRALDGPKCGECKRPILLDRPIKISDSDFERVLNGTDVPVIVDFYADWCGPCKVMAPLLDNVAREHVGKLLVTKLNTDYNPESAAKFGIGGIPTLVAFKGGKEVVREVGAVPKPRIDALVNKAIQA
jgi:thioredoxin 2